MSSRACRPRPATLTAEVDSITQATGIPPLRYATCMLAALRHNAHGHYGEALAAARHACEREDVIAYGWALVELIEAAVRGRQPEEAAAALDRLSERTRASGTQWALGIKARCRGLRTRR